MWHLLVATSSQETLLDSFARGRAGTMDGHTMQLFSLGLFDPDRLQVPIEKLSIGQQRRLAIARLFSAPADLLILDEPTNHLSPGLVEEVEAALNDYQGAVVVVSHDRRLRQRWVGEQRFMALGGLMHISAYTDIS